MTATLPTYRIVKDVRDSDPGKMLITGDWTPAEVISGPHTYDVATRLADIHLRDYLGTWAAHTTRFRVEPVE